MNTLELLHKYGFTTQKSLGQNFLADEKVLEHIITAADIQPTDEILEIGPGLGVMTKSLCKKAKSVSAIEKDERLLPILKAELKTFQNFHLIHQDALEYQPNFTKYKIVANIPYYITSPLINHFLLHQFKQQKPLPSSITLLTQKEVAEKICNKKNKLSVLAINIKIFGSVEIIDFVPAKSFIPAPKVDSAIIKITPFQKITITGNIDNFLKVVHSGFSQPRKKIHNCLSRALQIPSEEIHQLLNSLNINPNLRAEDLLIEDWDLLTKKVFDA
jgi:16S rRNA (adenine1518-N6/adenine1519-N6)-dimethyltransferase